MGRCLLTRSLVPAAIALALSLALPVLGAPRRHPHHPAHHRVRRVGTHGVRPARGPRPGPPRRDPSPGEETRASRPPDLDAIEQAILARINAARARNDLGALTMDASLQRLARSFSQRMAEQGFFSHQSPAGDSLTDRIRATGLDYHALGENLYQSRGMGDPTDTSVRGWMSSPGHRANILRSEFTRTGIGVWRAGDRWYVTQEFLGP